jgi:hypothetical protein
MWDFVLEYRQTCDKLLRSIWPNVLSLHEMGFNESGGHLVPADVYADLPARDELVGDDLPITFFDSLHPAFCSAA